MYGIKVMNVLGVFFVVVLVSANELKIIEYQVPDSVELGEDANLVCKYSVDNSQNAVEPFVKWFFTPEEGEGDQIQLYQKHGSGMGSINKKADFIMDVSDDNDGVLTIKSLESRQSGKYTCKVENLSSEDIKSQDLIVYSRGLGPELNYANIEVFDDDGNAEKKILVTCNVTDVSPEPELVVSIDGVKLITDNNVTYSNEENGFYNTSTMFTIKSESVEENSELKCEMFYVNSKIKHPAYTDTETYVSDDAVSTTETNMENTTAKFDDNDVADQLTGTSHLFRMSWYCTSALLLMATFIL